MKTVLVFGVFDGLHKGHDYFLKKARALGDKLVAVVARDTVVTELKNKIPKHPQIERKQMVSEHESVDEVMLGDRQLGNYQVIRLVNPNIVAIGYDQTELQIDLQKWISKNNKKIEVKMVDSLKPAIYKSSKLN